MCWLTGCLVGQFGSAVICFVVIKIFVLIEDVKGWLDCRFHSLELICLDSFTVKVLLYMEVEVILVVFIMSVMVKMIPVWVIMLMVITRRTILNSMFNKPFVLTLWMITQFYVFLLIDLERKFPIPISPDGLLCNLLTRFMIITII